MTTIQTQATAERDDLRAKTVMPYVAAGFAVVSGMALLVYAISLIQTPETIATILGIWNALVTLAYFWLAVQLCRRVEGAYFSGLLLSLGNVAFVWGQVMLWNFLGIMSGFGEDERAALIGVAPFIFILTDLLLAGGIYFSFRDLVHPTLPEDIPESEVLQRRLATAEDETRYDDPVKNFLGQTKSKATTAPPTQAEINMLLDLRRKFLAHMKSTARGGADLDVVINEQTVDLVVKPLWSYIMVDSQAEKQHQRFMFYPVITSVLEIEKARQGANYVLAISAAPDVLDQLTGFRAKSTGVYLLREKQWAPAGSSR